MTAVRMPMFGILAFGVVFISAGCMSVPHGDDADSKVDTEASLAENVAVEWKARQVRVQIMKSLLDSGSVEENREAVNGMVDGDLPILMGIGIIDENGDGRYVVEVNHDKWNDIDGNWTKDLDISANSLDSVDQALVNFSRMNDIKICSKEMSGYQAVEKYLKLSSENRYSKFSDYRKEVDDYVHCAGEWAELVQVPDGSGP
ncbi:hypothetical protein HNR23_003462 [Nocardiopsis mwathae]|uniref:Uncharacterized protein n=1 Tax=Nocardiopsis mwathae TaxID=1472723 RepID=A0A7X0D6D3_9ACTN|nr:hypothetical protein [Nocardiopsis mwathae]MBB6173402.1 hypothetical protein [Nocardiopsis mwathae]